jgi:uncharacterized membrane protein (Fun14 family)
MLLKMDIWM